MTDVNVHADTQVLLPLASRLSRRERAAAMLALGATSTITGRALEVDPSTVRRWRQRPDFAADVGRMRLKLLGAPAFPAPAGPSEGRGDATAGGGVR